MKKRPKPNAPKRGPEDEPRRDTEHLLYGRKPILELAKHRAAAIQRVLVRSGSKPSPELSAALTELEQAGLKIELRSGAELDELLPGVNHQGFVAYIAPRHPLSLDELIRYSKTANGLLVALDEVQDPHNLGSIFRAADAAGVDGLVLPRSHSAGLTGAARKVSAGATEFVRCAAVSNLAQALQTLKKEGFWIVGTALGDKTQSLFTADLPGPMVVVLGGEQDGLRRLTKDLCDYLVEIPMTGHVQSLNVGQAAAVTLFEIRRKLTHNA